MSIEDDESESGIGASLVQEKYSFGVQFAPFIPTILIQAALKGRNQDDE